MEYGPLTLKELVHDAYKQSAKAGFYDGYPTNIGEKLALIHSEISEALEQCRSGNHQHPLSQFFTVDEKPEGFAVELADAVIRIADLCGYLGIDLSHAVQAKMAYNATRPYRHGKAF